MGKEKQEKCGPDQWKSALFILSTTYWVSTCTFCLKFIKLNKVATFLYILSRVPFSFSTYLLVAKRIIIKLVDKIGI